MTRTVSSQVSTEVVKPVTSPGYLVEIIFPDPVAPLRVSSRGDTQWDGRFFRTYDFKVMGLDSTAQNSIQTGVVVFQDTDNSVGELVLAWGIGDREINVWEFYSDAALGTSDTVYLGQMRGADASGSETMTVTINLIMNNMATLYSPRTYLTKENGFNFLAPAGQILQWGSEKLILQPDGS